MQFLVSGRTYATPDSNEANTNAAIDNATNRLALKLSSQLRRIVDECGLSRYEISKRTGIAESTLSKFMHGERGLSMKALDRLGETLSLTVNMRRKPQK